MSDHKIIKESKVSHEFRTTVVPELIELDDVALMGELVKGADKWFFQGFKSDIDLVNPSFKGEKPFTKKELEKMREIGKGFVNICEIR